MYKAIIIDDIRLVRDAIKMLAEWDVFGIDQLLEADNAQTGLELICRERPDIIITDMKMPIMDGTQLLTKLNELSIPGKVIVISGFSDYKYTRLAIKSGVIDYILKPIDPQDLNNALSAAVAQIEEEKNTASGSDDPAPSMTSVNNKVIYDVLAYIDRNYLSPLSLTDLAEHFYLSKEHLSRLFKKETGQNLFSYIMSRKLNEAKHLLETTNMTLDDIAFHLGFSNGNYFSKVFKKNCDLSPSEYRIQINHQKE